MADRGPLSGTTLGGRYQLGDRLGSGGFADVYLGEHIHLKTQSAIKVLHTILSGEDIETFRNEARIVAHLDHPNILKVRDFDLDGGKPFLVMDYAPNGSLRQRHKRGECLPLNLVVSYVKQIAAALQYAHDQKLIHRDIKPQNLLLGRNYEVLLSDFGIAVIALSTSRQHTQGFAGTTAYSAPEQIQGNPHQASDQYSLGIVIYEWLTGECPFQGNNLEVATQQVLTPPPPLRSKVPSIPAAVEQVVLTALAKVPQQRFVQVAAFATALEQAGQGGYTTGGSTQAPVLPLTVGIGAPSYNQPPGATTSAVSVSALPNNTPPGAPFPYAGAPAASAAPKAYRGHSKGVNSVAWSPYSDRIASASDDGTVQVWDAATGQTLLTYRGHQPSAPESKQSKGLFQRMKSSQKTEQQPAIVISLAVNAVAWSPDGKQVASGGADGRAQTWNLTTGERVRNLGHNSTVYVAAWSPDGTRILFGDSGPEDKIKIKECDRWGRP